MNFFAQFPATKFFNPMPSRLIIILKMKRKCHKFLEWYCLVQRREFSRGSLRRVQIRLGASWRRRRRKSHLSAFPRPQIPQSCETKVQLGKKTTLETREECKVTFIQGRERSYHHTFSFPEIDLRNGRNAVEIRDLSHRFVSCEFYPRVHDRIMARLNDRDEKRYSFVWTLDL